MIKAEDLVLPPVAALRPYEPGKPIEELEREENASHVIKLASNENPLGPSPMAMDAMRSALAEVNRYPDGGCWALTRKIAARHQLGIERIFVASGSVEVLNLLERHRIDDLVVVDDNNVPVGVVDSQDLTRLKLL